MADVITRFKLETTQYDSKLRDSAKGLQEYTKQAELGGRSFTNFSQKSVEAAKALGTVASGANNLKDKVKDLVGAYNDAAKAYNKLSQEQQQSDFGKALSQSLIQLKGRITEAKHELYSLGDATAKMGSGGGGLGKLIGGISGKLGISPQMFTGIGAGIAAFGALNKAIGDNISTARGFEKSMSQLSSLTGMTGSDLEKLKEYAIDLGSTSTLTASQVADAFRLIGSQQPQLLSSGEALKEVTKYAITLSEAAGIDLQTAAQTLSTSINQMGGDSNNAARYVNVLAAASQKGAGDIAWLGEAITKSATAAKAVGTDYEELVANLEQLAKAGFDASTAGTALRSIIMNLEKQANQDFKPSIVGLTQAFENLGKANLDIVGYQQIAGKMFASQAMALANASQEAKKMTEAITGTNIAEAQAKTNTDNLDGALKSLASAWEGLNLHINSSNGLLKAFVDWCTNVIRDLDNMTTSAGRAKKALQELNGGGNGQPSKVDRQINGLRGSNFKQQKYNSTLGQYNHDIKVAEYYKKKYKEAGWTGGSVLSDITRRFGVNMRGEEDIDNLINNLKTLREDYIRRAEKILNSTAEADNGKGKGGVVLDVDADTEEATKSIKDLQEEIKKLKKMRDDAANAGNTKLRDQYNTQIKSVQAQIKSMRGTGSTTTTTHKATPQETAANKVKEAERTYAETLMKNSIRMEAGLDSTLEYKKRELSAQERLLDSYNDAYATYKDPKYKDAASEAANKIKSLAGEIKSMEDAVAKSKVKWEQGDSGFNTKTMQAWMQGRQGDLSKADYGTKEYKDIMGNIADMKAVKTMLETSIKAGIDAAEVDITPLWEKLFNEQLPEGSIVTVADALTKVYEEAFDGIDISDGTIQGLIDKINEKLKEKGLDPIKIDLTTGDGKGGDTSSNKNQYLHKNADGKTEAKANELLGGIAGGISQIAGGLETLGVEIPEELQSVLNGMMGISQILTGIATTILAIEAIAGADAIIPFARGGVVPHAATGYFVGGNRRSGDTTHIMANAGELVLNESSQNSLAADILQARGLIESVNMLYGIGNPMLSMQTQSALGGQLRDGGLSTLKLEAYVKGEQLHLVHNRFLRRSGQGEIVTWK